MSRLILGSGAGALQTVSGSSTFTVPVGRRAVVRAKSGTSDFTINGNVRLTRVGDTGTARTVIHYGGNPGSGLTTINEFTATRPTTFVGRTVYVVNGLVRGGYRNLGLTDGPFVTSVNGATLSQMYVGVAQLDVGDTVQLYHYTAGNAGDAKYSYHLRYPDALHTTYAEFSLREGDTISGGDYELVIYGD